MEAYEILAMIPRGKARIVANLLGVSESLVLKWQREPISDENPAATGTRNPVERLDLIFDFFLIHDPKAAAVIASRYQAKLDEFYTRVLRQSLGENEWNTKIATSLRENAEAMSAIIEKASPTIAREQWERAKLQIEEMIRRIEAGERANV